MEGFDPIEIFSEVAKDSLSAAVEEAVKSELTRRALDGAIAAASSEMAKALVEHLAGPLLKAFLKIIDPTQRKLDKLIAEPLKTGTSQASQGMALQIVTERDREFQQHLFKEALNNLETAHTYAKQERVPAECLKIRFLQASIAKAMGAEGAVNLYVGEYLTTAFREADDHYNKLIAQKRALDARLALYRNQMEDRRKKLGLHRSPSRERLKRLLKPQSDAEMMLHEFRAAPPTEERYVEGIDLDEKRQWKGFRSPEEFRYGLLGSKLNGRERTRSMLIAYLNICDEIPAAAIRVYKIDRSLKFWRSSGAPPLTR